MAMIQQDDEPVQQTGEAGNRGTIDTVGQFFGVLEGGDAAVDFMAAVGAVSQATADRAHETRKEQKGTVALTVTFTADEQGGMVLQVTKLEKTTPKINRMKSRLFVNPVTGKLQLVDPKQESRFDERGGMRAVRRV